MLKKAKLSAFVVLAAMGMTAAFATSASAFPTETSPCTGCHSGAGATIAATLVSTVGTTANYSVSAPGATAVAVFKGSTKLVTITASSGTFSVPAGSTYNLYAVTGPTTSDGVGSASISPAGAPADTTAPVTTSDAKATYVSLAAIKLTATDAGSGVAGTYYKLDGAAQVTGTSISVTALGSHTIEFWSVDVAGNIETHHTASFTITAPVPVDTTAPVTTSDALATYVSSATVKLTATDAMSGVAGTYYKLDGGAQVTGTSISVTALGSHTIEFWSVDVAGNIETHHTASFTVTAVPPVPTGTATTTVSIRAYTRGHDGEHRSRTISLFGALAPAGDNATVSLYVMTPGSSTWSLVKDLSTGNSDESNGGTWNYSCASSARGTYQFQVRFAGTDTLSPSVSRIVTVTVR